MGFFKKLRRLANPLRLNAPKPWNVPGIKPPGYGRSILGRFRGVERFRLPDGSPSLNVEKTGLQRIGLNDEMSFSALSDNMQETSFGTLNAGLSEAPSFWGGLGQLLGGAASKVIDAKAQAEVLKAQMGLYTPQNIELARRQAEFETAKAGGISSTVMIGAGLAALALVLLLRKK